ncbi:MAG: peptidylprolyl isomerase [Lachnospiraceae bacterium]
MLLLLLAIGWEWGQAQKLFTTELGSNTVIEVGGEKVSKQEFLLYVGTVANTYSDIYGEGVWELISGEDGTIGDDCIALALAEVSKLKALDLLAAEYGIALTEDEEELCAAAAVSFMAELSEGEVAYLGVDVSTVTALYEEKLRGDMLYELLLADVTPEISDEEARIVTVQHVLLKTYDGDGDGVIDDSITNSLLYEEAVAIREMALDGESFESLMSKYSQDTKTTYSFGKGVFEESFEEAAFTLSAGEISEVIMTSHGYHIVKCITSFDQEETELNKLVLMELNKQEAFGDTYEAFLETLEKKQNSDLITSVTIPSKEVFDNSNFFTFYDEYIKVPLEL